MPAISGFDRALPTARFDSDNLSREVGAKQLGHVFKGSVAVVILVHEGIADGSGIFPVGGFPRELRQGMCCTVMGMFTALIRRKIQVTERDAGRKGEAF